MILAAQDIAAYSPALVNPFYFHQQRAFGMTFGLGPAGYDIRVNQDLWMWPGRFTLASSIEYFNIPDNLLPVVADKSTWARRGLTVQTTVIEPGWKGFLTLELKNQSWWPFFIRKGMPIAQILFHTLSQTTDRPYAGKYQNQPSRPVDAIWSKIND